MKTEILHMSDCATHSMTAMPNGKCDCCPQYTIEKIESRAVDNASEGGSMIHEGERDAREGYFIEGGEYVRDNTIEILKLKMNQECSLSAKEYWYRCGIHDAIEILKQF